MGRSISKSKRYAVFNKFNGKCAYCGKTLKFKEFQVDHLISFKQAGTFINKESNLMPSCPVCNIMKGDGSLDVFRARMKALRFELFDSVKFTFAYRIGLVSLSEPVDKFYFETLPDQTPM